MQERVYRDVQTCATAFRRFCLEHGVLDFSLQMEVSPATSWTCNQRGVTLPSCIGT